MFRYLANIVILIWHWPCRLLIWRKSLLTQSKLICVTLAPKILLELGIQQSIKRFSHFFISSGESFMVTLNACKSSICRPIDGYKANKCLLTHQAMGRNRTSIINGDKQVHFMTLFQAIKALLKVQKRLMNFDLGEDPKMAH